MSYKINTEDLLRVLQQTIKVIPTRSTKPILGCALFSFSENLAIRASNQETSISSTININSQAKEGHIAIPIGRLIEITSNLKEEEIEFSLLEIIKLKLKRIVGNFQLQGKTIKNFFSIILVPQQFNKLDSN